VEGNKCPYHVPDQVSPAAVEAGANATSPFEMIPVHLTKRCCVTFLYVLSPCYEASSSAAWLSSVSSDDESPPTKHPCRYPAAGHSRGVHCPTVGRPYARGICWVLGLGESIYYGWHTNLQDVTVIRHDKKIDLRVTPGSADARVMLEAFILPI